MPHPEHAVDPDVGPTGGQPLFASLLQHVAGGWLTRDSDDRAAPPAARPDRRRARRDRRDPRARAEPHRARDVRGDVVRALLVQVLEDPPAHAADRGARGAGRARPGRRRGRRRRRARRRVQDRESHSHPERDRAVPGRGHGRRRDRARHHLDGRAAGRAARPAACSVRSPKRGTGGSSRAWSPGSGGTATASASPPSAARSGSPSRTRRTRRQRDVRRASPRRGPARDASALQAHEGSLDGAVRRVHRPRRDRRRQRARERDARGRCRGVAPQRADRRPVRREAPDRGLARADRRGICSRGCRTSGARGSPARSASPRLGPGLGADLDLDAVPLREPGMEPFEILTVGVAGADARDRPPVEARRSPGGLRPVGAATAAIVARRSPAAALDACAGGEVVARGAGAVARRRGPGLRPPGGAAPALDTPGGRPDLRHRSRRTSTDAVLRRCWRRRTSRASGGSFEQYDRIVQGNTVARPGAPMPPSCGSPGTLKAPRALDRRQGPVRPPRPVPRARRTRSPRRPATSPCTGARPLAITNCLNFGNPERPEVMWQFAESIRGIARRVSRLRHAGDRRQRQLLQRVAATARSGRRR